MNLKLKRHPGLYLVGFMASGKSTIGGLLAVQLGWTFVDLDDDIEAKTGETIAEIFDQQGEAEFRRLEHEALAERVKMIRESRPLILAIGGGAFVEARNRELIELHGVSIWIDCPFGVIQKRIEGFSHRPLARDPEAFRKRYDERRAAYAKADYRVENATGDPSEAVRAIMDLPGLL